MQFIFNQVFSAAAGVKNSAAIAGAIKRLVMACRRENLLANTKGMVERLAAWKSTFNRHKLSTTVEKAIMDYKSHDHRDSS